MNRLQTAVAPALGRLLICYIFIMSGYGKIGAPDGTIGYIAAHGLPLPSVAYALSVIAELGGGILLLLGLLTRPVALVLAVFCLITAFVFHGFGDMNSAIHAMKNIAMTGGFLYVAAYGAGEWSLDAALRRRRGLSPQPA
jgi:putative oxidoreductase